MRLDPEVKSEVAKMARDCLILSLVMALGFLIAGKLNAAALYGLLIGYALAVGNFFLLAYTVSRAVDKGKPEEAAQRVKATATLRLIGVGALSALLIGVFKTNVFATLIPLLFPRVAIAFRPILDRKRGTGSTGTEGSDLID